MAGQMRADMNSHRQTPSDDALEAAVAVAAARLRLRRLLAAAGTSEAGTTTRQRLPDRRLSPASSPQETPADMTSDRPPTFYPGQWLDVEDTVHQWLEATVMRVRSRRMLVIPRVKEELASGSNIPGSGPLQWLANALG